MKFKPKKKGKKIVGYKMTLSANETYQWARRPHKRWPCSKAERKTLWIEVDRNGLLDIKIDGKRPSPETGEPSIPSNELDAIISDHLPEKAKHLWPTWK